MDPNLSSPPYRSTGAGASVDSLADLVSTFLLPPPEARPMMRWWWFGPTVTRKGIDRELAAMRDAGIGGVEVQPVYPLCLDNPEGGLKTQPFLSPQFLLLVGHAAGKADEMGLCFDLTMGSGWPYGGPGVSPERSAVKLSGIRIPVPAGSDTVRLPALEEGESFLAVFSSDGADELQDIHEGVLRLPAGLVPRQEVWCFLQRRTNQKVKRAAVGAEGLVVDHLDRAALEGYCSTVGEPLLAACGKHLPRAVFCDSLEVYGSDWSRDFLTEFRHRRGYDFKPLLPLLVGGEGTRTKALRQDWGRTLTELLEERFLAPMQAWTKAHGVRFRAQIYGTPPATLSSTAFADLNEGEGTQWKHASASRLASSGAHLLGRTIVSSETWTWLNSPAFRASPLDLKVEADLHFLQGINQLVGHGWPYSPAAEAYPGWSFYAAAALNDKNPWWIVMPEICAYFQRTSALLRAGRPVTDVLFYLSNADGWGAMSPGQVNMRRIQMERLGSGVMGGLLAAGYNFDLCDDTFLAQARLETGGLVLGGNTYGVVIVPGVEFMPPATVRLLEKFAVQGGIVIAAQRWPDKAPGWLASPADHAVVRDTFVRLSLDSSAPNVRLVARDEEAGSALQEMLAPDLLWSLPEDRPDIGFVHRETAEADVYFVVNTANRPVSGNARFRISRAGGPQRWDAVTGKTFAVRRGVKTTREAIIVPLDLAPYESTFVIFPRFEATGVLPEVTGSPSVEETSLDLGQHWDVAFGETGLREHWEDLRSWTDIPETRHFSGVAHYEKTIELPPAWFAHGSSIRLEFGTGTAVEPFSAAPHGIAALLEAPVREAVVVEVNGTKAGSIWCSPYSLDLTANLRPGPNTLRLTVANLALNHIAGLPARDYTALHACYGERFQPENGEKIAPIKAGIFGPIRLCLTGAGAGMRADIIPPPGDVSCGEKRST